MSIAFKLGQAEFPQSEQSGKGGVALWLIQAARLLWKRAGSARLRPAKRQMELVETLALGGRKQLLLVRCGGQNFLVGAGADSVQTIVRVAQYTIANDAEEVSTC